MKFFKLFFFFSVFFFQTTNTQELISNITYKKKSRLISDSKKQKTEVDILAEKVSSEMNRLKYALIFNENSSVFFEKIKMDLDENKDSFASKLSQSFGGGDGIYYVNRKSNKTFFEHEFKSKLYLVEQDKISNWILTQEKKKIGNYTCFKATKNDTFVGSSGNIITIKISAWYTPEIPFSYGPIKYNGLPGLILELENDKAIFYASRIELNKKDSKEKVLQPKKGIEITQSKYDSIIMGMAKDFNKKYKRN